MNSWKSNSVGALVAAGLIFIACSGSDPSADGASGGSGNDMATGGRGSGTGGGSGAVLDLDALAANCQGLTAKDGASCGEADLVCRDRSGVACVCGGIVSTPTSMSGRPGSSSTPPRDLIWECFVIGGTESGGMGGLGGAGSEETGGENSGGTATGGTATGGTATGGTATGGSPAGGGGAPGGGGANTGGVPNGGSGGADLGGAAGATQ